MNRNELEEEVSYIRPVHLLSLLTAQLVVRANSLDENLSNVFFIYRSA